MTLLIIIWSISLQNRMFLWFRYILLRKCQFYIRCQFVSKVIIWLKTCSNFRLKKHYISLFVQLLRLNSSKKSITGGFLAKKEFPCSNLKKKVKIQKYGLARKLLFNTRTHSKKSCLLLNISNLWIELLKIRRLPFTLVDN